MAPDAERRLHELYDALVEAARESHRFRVDTARSGVADPLYYKRHDRGLFLRLVAEGGPRPDAEEPREATVTVPKTLRALRLAPPGGSPVALELDLRDGYRLQGREFPSPRDLARELLGRLAAPAGSGPAVREADAVSTRSRPRPGAAAA